MIKRAIGKPRKLFCIVSHRPVEWQNALIMIAIALILVMPGQTFSLPSYAAFIKEGISEPQAIMFFGGIGAIRILSLLVGGVERNARVRQVGAMCGGLAFTFAAATFAEPFFEHSQPMPIVAGIFTVLAIFEGYSIQMAGRDRQNGDR